MNISKILLVFILALSIVSCSSDDDNATSFEFNQANIVGVYGVTYLVSTSVETTDVNGLDIVTVTTITGDTFDIDFTFAENGTVLIDGAFRETFKTVVEGQTVLEDSEIIIIDNETSNYTVTEATKVIVIAEDNYKVTAFNQNGMTLTLEETTIETNGDSYVYNEELRLIRK